MLNMTNVEKSFNIGTVNEKQALSGLNLHVRPGDFITVIGGNGAGKSTMLNIISGVHKVDNGQILLDGEDITTQPEYTRAKHLGRVFQDPMMGTASNMSIEENLAMAYRRTKRRGFAWGITQKERKFYQERLATLDLGLEDRITTKVGLLSGGQRQAITLLMATLQTPKVLLLDEHTAALDPKTAKKVLALTQELVEQDHLTTIMVTHNMKDAIRVGNRLVMMHNGRIIYDVNGAEKTRLKTADLMEKFTTASGEELANDRMLLSE
ncbi:MAG: ABC transporter ATP-binding protein [Clostridiales bacterium]|nr:ABC transporter ATP-binding protein [Clostridiales bacterium]